MTSLALQEFSHVRFIAARSIPVEPGNAADP
jgi:hypothetical protein